MEKISKIRTEQKIINGEMKQKKVNKKFLIITVVGYNSHDPRFFIILLCTYNN